MRTFLLIILLSSVLSHSAQPPAPSSSGPNRPKLIVGIVVDQMRYDYLYKYWEKYGSGGFKRLIGEGFICRNTQFNYMPTYTGPGHASIYTGTTPSVHGIISNSWYSAEKSKMMYCSEDPQTTGTGTVEREGMMSPVNMLSTTFCDEWKLFTNFGARVYGVSLKDRAAILPAGHSANGAFWLESKSGHWISSSHYMKELPKWVQEENKKDKVGLYLSSDWNTLLPIAKYTESAPDNNPHEGLYAGETAPVFPHKLKEISQKSGKGLIKATPFGNTLLKDFAIELIRNEQLGKGKVTDIVAISFSSPDYIGHQFGPQSVELEDTYLRLDKDLADLLSFLDTWLGKGQVLVFLTADHAAAEVPSYVMTRKMPGGYYDEKGATDSLKKWSFKKYGDTLMRNHSNFQIFLDEKKILAKGLSLVQVEEQFAEWILRFKGVTESVTGHQLRSTSFVQRPYATMQAGYHPRRSGNVLYNLSPGWIEYETTGTTHGSPWSYDTRVPLIWYGWKIPKGESSVLCHITDIAPTISIWMNMNFPTGCTGIPIGIPVR
ncbi:MAG: alkaline phosphatase family protein [Bacteroidia bacterium]|nr:alkaline phosphatase family protein [Bacteroidia bacterium]